MYFKAIKDPQYLSIMSHKFLKRIIISFKLCFVALNPTFYSLSFENFIENMITTDSCLWFG